MKAFFRTTLFLAALTALLMTAGALIGGRGGMMFALVLAAAMNFGAWWFSDKLVLMQYRAQEVDETTAPNFYRIVRDLAHRANMPMPKVYIAEEAQPNAFATGRSPQNAAVCATSGLLQMLDHDEIAGVMAHELAHIHNRDTLIMTVAATIAGALGTLANMAMWSSVLSPNSSEENRSPLGGIGAVLVMILAPLAASLVQFAISRTREYEADRIGAQICGNPEALASALDKLQRGTAVIPMPDADANPATAHVFIANPLSHGASLQALFSTHPPMDERIRRLMAMKQEASSNRDEGEGTPQAPLRRASSAIPTTHRKNSGPWG